MSTTMSTIAAEAIRRSKGPVEERFSAASSAFAPVAPEAISALALAGRDERPRLLDWLCVFHK